MRPALLVLLLSSCTPARWACYADNDAAYMDTTEDCAKDDAICWSEADRELKKADDLCP